MQIKQINEFELLNILQFAWRVFSEDVIDTYSHDGVLEFQRYIKYESMRDRINTHQVFIFAAYEGQDVIGVLAIERDGMIRMFYTDRNARGRGVGRALIGAAYQLSANMLRINSIRVSAVPRVVEIYRHLGFVQLGPEYFDGKRNFVPMELRVFTPIPKKSTMSTLTKIFIIVGAIGFLAYWGISLSSVMKDMPKTMKEFEQQYPDIFGDDGNESDNGNAGNGNSGNTDNGDADIDEDNLGGMEGIATYKEDGVDYNVEVGNYSDNGKDKLYTSVDMYVDYPIINGLSDKAVQNKINEEIQNCAMQTVNEIYLKPSEEFKEKMIEEKNPALSSYVQYSVCYQGKDFISIMFSDKQIRGSMGEINVDYRTLNINLKDGTIYSVSDTLNIDDAFVKTWLKSMRSEADDDEFLSEFTDDELKQGLISGKLGDNFHTMMFATKTGFEIGFMFNGSEPTSSGEEKSYDKYSWVTGPIKFDELKKFQKGSMWELIGKS